MKTALTTIDLDEALLYAQTNGYTCTKAAGGSGLDTLVSLGSLAPSLTWLCIAGFMFFFSKLVVHERSAKRKRI